ncbi:MAG: hypothetical protein ABEH56_04880 [Salinirussus sp.]
MSTDDGPVQREVAYRLFAAEFDDSDYSFSESDEERAPNYVVTPTGARVNRLFVVGVLTEVEHVGDDVLRGRVVDPTGAFVVYAGQYQPDEQAFLERATPPTFVAVTGKARTFQPEDSERVFSSVRPETVSEVDVDTRDRWTVEASRATLDRVRTIAGAKRRDVTGEDLRRQLRESGVSRGLADGIPLALERYGTTGDYLAAVRRLALDAARVVAGDVDEVEPLELAPGEGGDGPVADLASEGPEREVPAAEETTGSGTEGGSTPDASPASDSRDEDEDDTDTELSEPVPEDDDLGDFEPGEFELDDEEREEIESEFGTDFRSGTEVDGPGEAGIETPDPGEGDTGSEDEDESESEAEPVPETADAVREPELSDEGTETGQGTDDADGEPELPEDMSDAVVDLMTELDDGGGADRSAVVEAAGDRYGADEATVEEAIQDALMEGRCYEPDDETLKPI